MISAGYYHPDNGNAGDTAVDIGCRVIMHEALGTHYQQSCVMGRSSGVQTLPLDVAVISGTPWIWEGCWSTTKYADLAAFLTNCKSKSVKIALGVGSAFTHVHLTKVDPLKYDWTPIQPYWKNFDLVVCRDPLAHRILTRFRIPSLYAKCPSLFAEKWFAPLCEERTDKTLTLYSSIDDKNGLPSGLYAKKQEVERVRRRFDNTSNDLLTMTRFDDIASQKVKSRGKRFHTTDPEKIRKICARYSRVETMRVHGALLAKSAGCDVGLYACDSRACTAFSVGVNQILSKLPWEDWCDPNPKGLSEVVEQVSTLTAQL